MWPYSPTVWVDCRCGIGMQVLHYLHPLFPQVNWGSRVLLLIIHPLLWRLQGKVGGAIARHLGLIYVVQAVLPFIFNIFFTRSASLSCFDLDIPPWGCWGHHPCTSSTLSIVVPSLIFWFLLPWDQPCFGWGVQEQGPVFRRVVMLRNGAVRMKQNLSTAHEFVVC